MCAGVLHWQYMYKMYTLIFFLFFLHGETLELAPIFLLFHFSLELFFFFKIKIPAWNNYNCTENLLFYNLIPRTYIVRIFCDRKKIVREMPE